MIEGKKVIFVGFWNETLQQLIDFLEIKEFEDRAMLDHMKEVLEGEKK